jgi:hypothetical protein
MGKAGYTAATGADVATGTTIKCALAVIAPAQFGIDLKKFRYGFRNVVASEVPHLVELYSFTTDGTGTAGTVNQVYGRTITAGFTTKYNYTANPTGLTLIEQWTLDPNKGLVIYDFPLGDTPDTAVSNGIGIFSTGAVTALARGTLWFERV